MKPAMRPPDRPHDGRLLMLNEHGVSHRRRSDFAGLLHPGDLVVANDAATLPASLAGVHGPTGAAIEVRLAGRRSLAPGAVTTFTAVVFGEGDYRTPTEQRPSPPPLAVGDELILGPLCASVVRVLGHPRLAELRVAGSPDAVWRTLAWHGRPIQYAYVPEPLAIWDTWTRVAGVPVAFEAPSAGFLLDWTTVRAIRARGARFATLTHAAGLSSTGDRDLDRRLPFDEPYDIPRSTADLIAATRALSGRVIAIGTTVVRALEDAADGNGRVRAGAGLATRRIGPDTPLRIVDAIVSGMHEAGTSHYELLKAFVDDESLERMASEADAKGYLAHEFGDAVFIVGRREPSRRGRPTAAFGGPHSRPRRQP